MSRDSVFLSTLTGIPMSYVWNCTLWEWDNPQCHSMNWIKPLPWNPLFCKFVISSHFCCCCLFFIFHWIISFFLLCFGYHFWLLCWLIYFCLCLLQWKPLRGIGKQRKGIHSFYKKTNEITLWKGLRLLSPPSPYWFMPFICVETSVTPFAILEHTIHFVLRLLSLSAILMHTIHLCCDFCHSYCHTDAYHSFVLGLLSPLLPYWCIPFVLRLLSLSAILMHAIHFVLKLLLHPLLYWCKPSILCWNSCHHLCHTDACHSFCVDSCHPLCHTNACNSFCIETSVTLSAILMHVIHFVLRLLAPPLPCGRKPFMLCWDSWHPLCHT